ncbi:protein DETOXIFICATION 16-like [Hordeum vulgare subsp. vulgare]|uniref:protein DETOXIFICATION 16-like n=1 Tax=Hordeum vulgare subsp. vulgare TaxID=112509 RepID=UPI001D1A43EE|nr:protein DETOXIFICATION 16-like [Hordeum vulgare subsp. vulgare]
MAHPWGCAIAITPAKFPCQSPRGPCARIDQVQLALPRIPPLLLLSLPAAAASSAVSLVGRAPRRRRVPPRAAPGSQTWYWVCWVLVHKVGLGSKGAALASAVSDSTYLAILCLYTRLSGACRRTWTGFSMEAFAFKELRQFAELAIPSTMMVCFLFFKFELLVLLSGLLPNPKLETSVLSICLNTGALMFTVSYGLCAAISTRVSNELGAGRPQVARLATIVVICMALFAGSVISITMILLRKSWGYMYSNEEEVVTYIARMIPVLGVSFFVDGIHTSLSVSGNTKNCIVDLSS